MADYRARRVILEICDAGQYAWVRKARSQACVLHQFLVDHFSEGELRDLCFNLGVDFESLPAEGKAREMK
jgi:Effector-associated domain 7